MHKAQNISFEESKKMYQVYHSK